MPAVEVEKSSAGAYMRPSVFAVASGKVTASYESNNVATLRLTFSGSRSVVCMQGEQLCAFLQEETPDKVRPDPAAMGAAVKSWSAEDGKKFQQRTGARLLRGTIGPQDGLILPADWFFAEKVHGDDVIGLRFPFLRVEDSDVLDAVMTRTLAQSKGGNPAPALQAIVDFLTLYEPK